MYGIPANLDLEPFHGDDLTQVCVGAWDIQFKFTKGGEISVWGHWELQDAAGTLLDQAVEDPVLRDCHRVHRILKAIVVGSSIDPPRAFALHFDNGMTLRIFDSSEQYESCSIDPGGIII
jgi:hypothetical protein